MKKIISIVAIFFCFATSYAQDTKPTKQETMDWIAEKFKNYTNQQLFSNAYVSYHYIFIKSIENKITLYRVTTNIENGQKFNVELTIDFNKLTNVSKECSNEELTDCIELNGTNGLIYESGEYFDKRLIYSKFEGKLFTSLINFNAESNLKDRFIIALIALSNYNTAEKPKEKY